MVWSITGLAQASDWIYTTRPGDNLWNISKTHLKSVTYWKRLQDYNRVNLPKHLSPGIRLKIPIAWLKYPPEPVNVIFAVGRVQVVREGKTISLSTGDKLHIGDTIQTQEGSTSLKFADGSTLLVQSHSELILDSLSAYKQTGMVDTQLRLQRGRVETKVIPLQKPGSRYEIITPAAVAAVRGTRYRVSADAEQKLMRAEVLGGSVAVANKKASQDVAANYGTLTEAGKAPKPPRKLLPPPQISVPQKIRKMPTTISWDPIAGARSYRIFVTTDADNDEPVFDTSVKTASVLLSTIPDGAYRIKVRAVDELGLEGINGVVRALIDTRLGPPLIWPRISTPQMDDNTVTFVWEPVADAQSYHIQIADNEAFTNLMVDQQSDANRIELPMKEGTYAYYFRIRANSDLHKQGEFSPVVIAERENHGFLYFLGTVLIILAI